MIIVNAGQCDRTAIELMGLSTSRGNHHKIGQFGSGAIYALVAAMRLGMKVTISSRDKDGAYDLSTWVNKDGRVYFRYKTGMTLFGFITERTRSVATTFHQSLGTMDWTQPFQVVREFVTNAYDASPGNWAVFPGSESDVARGMVTSLNGEATVVTIDSDEADKIYDKWYDFFRLKPTLGVSALIPATVSEGVYGKPKPGPLRLFHKGVLLPWPSTAVPVSMFDYEGDFTISEARTVVNTWYTQAVCARLMAKYLSTPTAVKSFVEWLKAKGNSFEASLEFDTWPTVKDAIIDEFERIAGHKRIASYAPPSSRASDAVYAPAWVAASHHERREFQQLPSNIVVSPTQAAELAKLVREHVYDISKRSELLTALGFSA